MNDSAFLLAVLNDGREHSLTEIIEASQRERGCGLTVHSRAADLRKRGYTIRQRSEITASGRRLSFYRLVTDSPFAQSGPVTDDGHPGPTVRGSSVAERDDRIHGDDGAGPDCGNGQLALLDGPRVRGAYEEAAA